jgi:diguanylate cyclase (GGDEF)-like protein
MTVPTSRITGPPVRVGGGAEDVTDVDAANPEARTTGPDAAGPHDPLTGVANWQLFVDRGAVALARAARNGWSTALLVIDLDRFHQINDRFGHESGNSVLAEVARRLSAGFRPFDTVGRPEYTLARVGDDEFRILCENVTDPATARSLGRRVADLLEAPVGVHDGEVLVTAAVGVTLAPPGEVDIEVLIVQADSAMRRAKQTGFARTVFAPDMAASSGDSDAAEVALRRAFTGGELRLRYQPKVALDSDRIVGAEALLYWQHPERGMVPPCEFIPLAEETGLIVAIGSWVIEEACREAARWRSSFPDIPALVVSVNVSARQFGAGLVDVVARALSATAIDPGTLCLEVTESVLMHDTEETVAILQELAGLGVSLSIDDFGTGYSSLSYLKRFPLHELKIDKSFVDGLGKNDQDTAIVAAVVAMAHALDLSVVAEGVETADQLQRLRTLGCEQAQGYHLARPGPPGAIDKLLRGEASPGGHSHARRAEGSGAPSETSRPNRILVVDDDANVRQLARMSLATVGFEVYEAVDGPSALSAATHISPDCILLDVAMPDMSGLEVCRALRADPRTAQCTILMLAIGNDPRDKIEAFSSAADDYIIKPFSPRNLVSRVHSAIRRRREARGPTLPLEHQSAGDSTRVPSIAAAVPETPR